jgi:hypothetical protein
MMIGHMPAAAVSITLGLTAEAEKMPLIWHNLINTKASSQTVCLQKFP